MDIGILKKIFYKYIPVENDKKRFRNIIEFSKGVIEESFGRKNYKEIFTVVKMLSDSIAYKNARTVVETYTAIPENNTTYTFLNLLTLDKLPNDMYKFLYGETYKQLDVDDRLNIVLGSDPIIATVWERLRFRDAIAKYGTENTPWKQDKYNHEIDVFLPMGLSMVVNGNHSIAPGMLKSEGTIEAGKGTPNHIYDVSGLYDFIEFDGLNYVSRRDKSILFKANSFEFGCIFEIGRLVEEKHISFTSKRRSFG